MSYNNYNKFQKKEDKVGLKDYTILLQNLLNRATEVELHNAKLENRKADVELISGELDKLLKVAGGKLAAFINKNKE